MIILHPSKSCAEPIEAGSCALSGGHCENSSFGALRMISRYARLLNPELVSLLGGDRASYLSAEIHSR